MRQGKNREEYKIFKYRMERVSEKGRTYFLGHKQKRLLMKIKVSTDGKKIKEDKEKK